jgi:hypothetical protein
MRCPLVLCLLLSACGGEQPQRAHDRGWQGFSLGVMPIAYTRTGEMRYLVSVPRRYIDLEWLPNPLLTDDQGRIVANAIRFGVKYPSLEPTPDAWEKGSIRVTIGNMVEDGISKSVDGSWLNYYSQYHVRLADEYGLKVRRADFDPLDARLYFLLAPDLHVRIKCETNLTDKNRWCVLAAKRPGEPYLGTGFYANELPHWRERLARLSSLFRSEGKQKLRTVHRNDNEL